MRRTTYTLTTQDRIHLHTRATAPDDARGLVVISHGLGEHGGRYHHVADALAEAGYVCVHYDHRGHGRSTGLRGHVDGFTEYATDLRGVVDDARERHGDLPTFVYGHSMGGLVVLVFLLEHRDAGLTGYVVSNPLIRPAFTPPRLKVLAGRLLARVLPKLRMPNELDTSGLSRDPEVIKAYVDDPLVHSLISTRWYTSMTEAADRVVAEAGDIDLPGHWVLSGKDPVVDAEAGRSVAQSTRSARIADYPDSVHEPHNDLDQGDVLGAISAFLASLAS